MLSECDEIVNFNALFALCILSKKKNGESLCFIVR